MPMPVQGLIKIRIETVVRFGTLQLHARHGCGCVQGVPRSMCAARSHVPATGGQRHAGLIGCGTHSYHQVPTGCSTTIVNQPAGL